MNCLKCDSENTKCVFMDDDDSESFEKTYICKDCDCEFVVLFEATDKEVFAYDEGQQSIIDSEVKLLKYIRDRIGVWLNNVDFSLEDFEEVLGVEWAMKDIVELIDKRIENYDPRSDN